MGGRSSYAQGRFGGGVLPFATLGPGVGLPNCFRAIFSVATELVSLAAPALLNLFKVALDSSLVERGTRQALELIGSSDQFWRACAVSELESMAAGGNAAAQAELAWRYAVGEGVGQSYAHAMRWASRSAEMGVPAGSAVLGWLIYQGAGVPQDHVEAARLFRFSADSGDQRGAIWYGLCLLRGHGVVQNTESARAYLRPPAEAGLRLAQYWLGRIDYFFRCLCRCGDLAGASGGAGPAAGQRSTGALLLLWSWH